MAKPYALRNKRPASAAAVKTEGEMMDVMQEWEVVKKIGRPSKLSPEVIETVCSYIVQGNYIQTACSIAGITRSLYDQWADRAREDMEIGLDEEKSEFIRFLVFAEKAKAFADHRLLLCLQAAGAGTWQKYAWILERTRPSQFGQRTQLEITQDITVTQLSVPDAPVDARTWLAEAIAAEQLVGRLRLSLDFDISDAEVVPDAETLVRVEVPRSIEDKPAENVAKKPRKALRQKR